MTTQRKSLTMCGATNSELKARKGGGGGGEERGADKWVNGVMLSAGNHRKKQWIDDVKDSQAGKIE